VTSPLLEAIAEAAALDAGDVVLDAGCGEGFYLGELARRPGCEGHGVDISIPAVQAAARRYPPLDPSGARFDWVVANADRFLPYADASFSIALSITGRIHAGELRRVLREDGRLLVAIPSPEDLIELRGTGRDRVASTVEACAAGFRLVDRRRAASIAELDREGVEQVLHSIYRPRRRRPVEAMRLTFSLDLLLFRCAAISDA
jgi:23S rRNA (guanine745-N1)-methyltransferase